MSNIESFSIQLPPHYRSRDFLEFHQRDPMMVSEYVQHDRLTKGIVWQGVAVQLTIKFEKNRADATLLEDESHYNHSELQQIIERMLGLQQNVAEFEQAFKNHHQLSKVISKNPGLRVAVTATPFEAISWAITGQQISVYAAISIRRKLIQLTGVQHSSGLMCYPDEFCISKLSQDDFRQAGFSQTKANTLIALSKHLVNNTITLNNVKIDKKSIESLSQQLLQIRGIGPWSINYALLRGFGWLDGSLHGDVAVRRSLQILLGDTNKISEKETQQWLLEFSPWRALVAAHLWKI